MRTVDICHFYFKQGDDMRSHLETTANPAEAFEALAQQLAAAARDARKISKIIRGRRVEIQADTTNIALTGADEVVDRLVAAKLATEWQDDEDDLEEDK